MMIAVVACSGVVAAGCSDDDNQNNNNENTGNQNNGNENNNENNNNDLCGNDAIDALEDCDGSELAGATCVTRGFASGDLTCSSTCAFDESDCTAAPFCGDGNLDSGEVCDDGNTTDGDGCSADCLSDETCGNGFVDTGEQCDDGDQESHDQCSSGCLDETLDWVVQTTDATAGERYYHGAAFDSHRNRLVVFGGSDNSGYLADTWELDGVSWSETTPATSPSPRVLATLSYDATRQVTVLFGGGYNPGGGYTNYSDTWEYDGSTWTQITTTNTPPGRRGHSMVYDSDRGVTVLFGGFNTAPLNDTWEYDGTTWHQELTANAPLSRTNHQLVFFLLEMLNNLIQYQFDGNSNLAYTMIR